MSCIAYYCSGHGYGHATRVSAFASHLCALQRAPTIYIVSSAPKHVFSDSIARGVKYRFAEIDPVIIQPLAYHVDRRKSLAVLRNFIACKDQKVEEEVEWVRKTGINCILSDAAFLACLVAHSSRIPCALITNFTFDSVYSYLCTKITDESPSSLISSPGSSSESVVVSPVDIPLSSEEIMPLVEQMHAGYRCADLLLLLPGSIPIPSFRSLPALPSYDWVDPMTNSLYPQVLSYLTGDSPPALLLPSIRLQSDFPGDSARNRQRQVIKAPLVVRHPSQDIYTSEGRQRLLDAIGVPPSMQSSDTKVLIVSFGGQTFRRPHSRNNSRPSSRDFGRDLSSELNKNDGLPKTNSSSPEYDHDKPSLSIAKSNSHSRHLFGGHNDDLNRHLEHASPRRLTTPSHLWVPGAPPAVKNPSPVLSSSSQFSNIIIQPPTPQLELDLSDGSILMSMSPSTSLTLALPRLLPDSSWIAIVCGVPKQWGQEDGEELPEGFFIAPRDVYMPDLTAVADVLLGKLGYGTVSECVDACTPFVYVPRPLFIEEHGLKLLLDQEGVGVELSRLKYEDGDWASSVEEAWLGGHEMKESKRKVGETGKRQEEGRTMAEGLMKWVEEWE